VLKYGNLFDNIPARTNDEFVETLLETHACRLERIVSRSHVTPHGTWYDQAWPEWVVLLTGSAELLIEAEPLPRRLKPGDHILIPPHVRHRVEWTDSSVDTVWLALHQNTIIPR
jgi:cupin 2 domain-containing protein